MRFRILGGLAVRLQSGELALHSEFQRRVLGRLLVHANAPVAVAQLTETDWSNKPEDPAVQVRAALAELRDLLDPHRPPGSDGSLIELSDGRFLLAVARNDLDTFVFEDGIAAARRLRSQDLREQTAAMLRKTLQLWRGLPLEGLTDPLLDVARGRLGALRLAAMEDLFEAELACGRHFEVLPELYAATAEFPLRERVRGALMVALYRSGRQVEALQEYAELEARLAAARNFPPSAALRTLRDRIQYFEPYLILPVVPKADPEVPQVSTAPEPERELSGLLFERLLAAVLPFVTCGFGTPFALAVMGHQRKDYRLVVPAVLSLAASVVPLATGRYEALGIVLLAESCYLVAIVGSPDQRWWPSTWWPRRRWTREAAKLRRRWRKIARRAPDQLRTAGIGRPDLMLGTDDGGLVDLNTAPVEVLITIKGVGAREAALIIQSRTWWPFWSVQELQTRGLMRVSSELRERLLILPPV
ncbi:hypothetical protein E1263_27965 [Kribbella antibiotica]|uniref:Bacterial transcriptional activator domain-containing protein n=1 Tax=Kribbella antibiotica TaxID=190195 RepID=A0A4V2YN92_9ACTN|nr:BTAD domain-containing putative transcriptional regulator [Kribbella antibiotica]TDD53447.1 hypothetical protein E1263_27965 [Kribbella antibiotica]